MSEKAAVNVYGTGMVLARRRVWLLALVAVLIASTGSLVLTVPPASADSNYEVFLCDPSNGNADNLSEWASKGGPSVAATDDCFNGGLTLYTRSAGARDDEGDEIFSAPADEAIVGLTWTGEFDAYDGWVSEWRAFPKNPADPSTGSPFLVDGSNTCSGATLAKGCSQGPLTHTVTFAPSGWLELWIQCRWASTCTGPDDSRSFLGYASDASIQNAGFIVDDPDTTPDISPSGSLWDENGEWISGKVPPAAGPWQVDATATDPGSVCTFKAYIAPSGQGEDQNVEEDDQSSSPDFSQWLPCGQTSEPLSWQPQALASLANGAYDVHVVADNPGSGTGDHDVTVDVDNDPPPAVTGLKATTSAMGPGGWSSVPTFDLSWSTPPDDSGAQSPVDKAAVSECDPDGNNCNTNQQPASPSAATVTLPSGASAGDYRGFVWDIDKALNQGAQKAVDLPYDPDQPAAPTLTPGRPGPVGQKQAATIPEQVYSPPGASGIYGYQVAVDSQPTGDWNQVNVDADHNPPGRPDGSGDYDLSTLKDGLHTLYARAFSGAGVASQVSQTSVDVEQNGPTLTVTPSPSIPPDGQVNGPVSFALGCVDRPDPGCDSITYQVDGGAPVTVPGDTASVPVAGDGTHTVAVYSTDKAGNQSATTDANFQIAAPGTPPPANPPAVFSVTPAPTATDTSPAFQPPVKITGLIDGTYINASTKYLTLHPTAPSPLKPATVTVTLGKNNVTLPCRTVCRYTVPNRSRIQDGGHRLCAVVAYDNGTASDVTCVKVGLYRTADAWAVGTERVSAESTRKRVIHLSLWTAAGWPAGSDLKAINREVLLGRMPPMPTNWQSYINGDQGSDATARFWRDAAAAGYVDVTCPSGTNSCFATGTHAPWCKRCQVFYQFGQALLVALPIGEIGAIGLRATAELFAKRFATRVTINAGDALAPAAAGAEIAVKSLATGADRAIFWALLTFPWVQ